MEEGGGEGGEGNEAKRFLLQYYIPKWVATPAQNNS